MVGLFTQQSTQDLALGIAATHYDLRGKELSWVLGPFGSTFSGLQRITASDFRPDERLDNWRSGPPLFPQVCRIGRDRSRGSDTTRGSAESARILQSLRMR